MVTRPIPIAGSGILARRRLPRIADVAEILSGAIGRRIEDLPIAFVDVCARPEATRGTPFADIDTTLTREPCAGQNGGCGDGVMRATGRHSPDLTEFAKAAAWAGKWANAA